MKGLLLFARARNGWWLLPLALLGFALARWAPQSLVASPVGMSTMYSPALVWCGLPGALGYLALRQPGFDMELRTQFLVWVRALWWVIVVCCLTVPAALAVLPSLSLPVVQARNSLLLLGIGYWTVRALGYEFGWVLSTVTLGTTVFFGTTNTLGEPAWWAFLLWPITNSYSWLLTGVIAGSAWLAYAIRDLQRPWVSVAS